MREKQEIVDRKMGQQIDKIIIQIDKAQKNKREIWQIDRDNRIWQADRDRKRN